VSLVERKPKLTRLAKVMRKTAALVTQAVSARLQPLLVKSITSDNGREFAGHQQIGQRLKAAFYFAHPYHSWERGLNERHLRAGQAILPEAERILKDHRQADRQSRRAALQSSAKNTGL
jgi:IS30 family transposase